MRRFYKGKDCHVSALVLTPPICMLLAQFGLTAEWPTWELSPLQEAAEYLTADKEDDHSYFWSFIDELEGSHAAIDAAAASSAYRSEEHDSIWALTLERATPLIHQLSHSLLQLYLAMRIYAPTMEVHRSLRRGASRWGLSSTFPSAWNQPLTLMHLTTIHRHR